MMLQDAAIFHLKLFEKLRHKGISLKDAHPWNILFDKGKPIFVDFTSLVTNKSLFAEDYLESNMKYNNEVVSKRLAMVVYEIFMRMYKPYFINPLLFYACGERNQVLHRIEETTLNSSTSTISVRECMPKLQIRCSLFKKVVEVYQGPVGESRAFAKLRSTFDLAHFYADMRKLVQSLEVASGGSAYASYYQDKGEDQDFVYSASWNAKQKSVHDALNSPNIHSVLDIACNTGWFSLMAERLGKSVVAFDVEEGCIEVLYKHVRALNLDILPLVMDFTLLTKDRYSIYDGNKVLINAAHRFCADSVLALGIIHHLVLGIGLNFDKILDSLCVLCKKQLIVEYVSLQDEMILKESSFFSEYHKNKSVIVGYDLDTLIDSIKNRGFDVKTYPSHPETRKILVCSRWPQS